jgi:hypothetical protein
MSLSEDAIESVSNHEAECNQASERLLSDTACSKLGAIAIL